MADVSNRLSSWRGEVDIVTPPAKPSMVEEDVRRKQLRISALCLTSQQLHDAFIADVREYVESGERDPHHQQRVNDYAAFLLRVYERHSTSALHNGISFVMEDLPREVIRVHTISLPHRPFLKRLFSG
jgi:hypothetical protein